eukprot:g2865.t1
MVFRGKLLQDPETLKVYNLSDGDKINTFVPIKGGIMNGKSNSEMDGKDGDLSEWSEKFGYVVHLQIAGGTCTGILYPVPSIVLSAAHCVKHLLAESGLARAYRSEDIPDKELLEELAKIRNVYEEGISPDVSMKLAKQKLEPIEYCKPVGKEYLTKHRNKFSQKQENLRFDYFSYDSEDDSALDNRKHNGAGRLSNEDEIIDYHRLEPTQIKEEGIDSTGEKIFHSDASFVGYECNTEIMRGCDSEDCDCNLDKPGHVTTCKDHPPLQAVVAPIINHSPNLTSVPSPRSGRSVKIKSILVHPLFLEWTNDPNYADGPDLMIVQLDEMIESPCEVIAETPNSDCLTFPQLKRSYILNHNLENSKWKHGIKVQTAGFGHSKDKSDKAKDISIFEDYRSSKEKGIGSGYLTSAMLRLRYSDRDGSLCKDSDKELPLIQGATEADANSTSLDVEDLDLSSCNRLRHHIEANSLETSEIKDLCTPQTGKPNFAKYCSVTCGTPCNFDVVAFTGRRHDLISVGSGQFAGSGDSGGGLVIRNDILVDQKILLPNDSESELQIIDKNTSEWLDSCGLKDTPQPVSPSSWKSSARSCSVVLAGILSRGVGYNKRRKHTDEWTNAYSYREWICQSIQYLSDGNLQCTQMKKECVDDIFWSNGKCRDLARHLDGISGAKKNSELEKMCDMDVAVHCQATCQSCTLDITQRLLHIAPAKEKLISMGFVDTGDCEDVQNPYKSVKLCEKDGARTGNRRRVCRLSCALVCNGVLPASYMKENACDKNGKSGKINVGVGSPIAGQRDIKGKNEENNMEIENNEEGENNMEVENNEERENNMDGENNVEDVMTQRLLDIGPAKEKLIKMGFVDTGDCENVQNPYTSVRFCKKYGTLTGNRRRVCRLSCALVCNGVLPKIKKNPCDGKGESGKINVGVASPIAGEGRSEPKKDALDNEKKKQNQDFQRKTLSLQPMRSVMPKVRTISVCTDDPNFKFKGDSCAVIREDNDLGEDEWTDTVIGLCGTTEVREKCRKLCKKVCFDSREDNKTCELIERC